MKIRKKIIAIPLALLFLIYPGRLALETWQREDISLLALSSVVRIATELSTGADHVHTESENDTASLALPLPLETGAEAGDADFIEVAFTSSGEGVAIYWNATHRAFYGRRFLTGKEDATARDLTTEDGAPPIPLRLEDNPGKPLEDFVFEQTSPFIPLAIRPAVTNHAVRKSKTDYYTLATRGNKITVRPTWQRLTDNANHPDAGEAILTLVAKRGDDDNNNHNKTKSTETEPTTSIPIPAIATVIPTENPFASYTLEAGINNKISDGAALYYTRRSREAPFLSIERVPLTGTSVNFYDESADSTASSSLIVPFLSKTNSGHHYYPFYWAAEDALASFSIESLSEAELLALKESDARQESEEGEKESFPRFKTQLHLHHRDGSTLYSKAFLLSTRPQLLVVKMDTHPKKPFLAVTSSDASPSLFFVRLRHPVDKVKTDDIKDADSTLSEKLSTASIPFELAVAELQAIYTFAFTRPPFAPGIIFIGRPHDDGLQNAINSSNQSATNSLSQTSTDNQDQDGNNLQDDNNLPPPKLYWAALEDVPLNVNPASWGQIFLSVLSVILAVGLLGFTLRRDKKTTATPSS